MEWGMVGPQLGKGFRVRLIWEWPLGAAQDWEALLMGNPVGFLTPSQSRGPSTYIPKQE